MSQSLNVKDVNQSSENVSRPTSAKGKRTSSISESTHSQEIKNTKYLVAFDSDLRDAYPSRSDSQTDLIIQELKQTLSSPLVEDSHDSTPVQEKEKTFPFDTSVPENTLDEARRRQRKRDLEKMAMLGRIDEPKKTLSMQEILNNKAHEHYKRGLNHSENGRFEDAITSFTKATNLQPNNINLFIERAEAYLQLCDFQSAIINYKRAHSLEPHNPFLYEKLAFIYYLQGQCYFDVGMYNAALESFTYATDMRPGMQGYHIRAMACLAALDRNQECLALLTRKIEAEATANPELYVMRARLHEKCKNATLCYYDVRDALALDPAQPQASKMMDEIKKDAEKSREAAVKLTVEGKLNEALNKITTSIDTDPSVPEFHVFRGALQRRLSNFNAAIDDYLVAMDKADHNESHPAYIDSQKQLLLTYNDFAVYCYQKGFLEEAVVLLNKAVKGEKMEKGIYINRGDCFFKQGDLTFALADYQQALELDETSWEARCRIAVVHNELGIASYQAGAYQESMQRFTAAIEQNPKVGQFYVHRARARYIIQDVDAARHDVLISLHLDPDNDEIVPLASRLFPGRSISEVLQSKAADAARKFISNVIGGGQTINKPLPPLTAKSSTTRTKTRESKSRVSVASEKTAFTMERSILSTNSKTPTPSNMPRDVDLIKEKKQANLELKNIFSGPSLIGNKGPRVLTKAKPKPYNSDKDKAKNN